MWLCPVERRHSRFRYPEEFEEANIVVTFSKDSLDGRRMGKNSNTCRFQGRPVALLIFSWNGWFSLTGPQIDLMRAPKQTNYFEETAVPCGAIGFGNRI